VLAAKGQELDEVFQALKAKQMKVDEVHDATKTLLSEGVLLTARDNDAYFGQAMKVFGRVFTTLNYDQSNDNADAKDAEAYLKEHSTIGPVTGTLDRLRPVLTLRGAIVPIASRAAGAAVTNVIKDADGTLRRINLLFRMPGENGAPDKIFGQLAFVPVWVRLGKPAIEVTPSRLILKTSALKENARPDIVIPLDSEGKMVINWPHATYWNSFRNGHVRVSELQELQEDTAILEAQVKAMEDHGYFDQDLMGMSSQAKADRAAALAAGDSKAFDAALAEESSWRQAIVALAEGTREQDLKTILQRQARDPKIPQASKDKIPGLIDDVGVTFTAFRNKVHAFTDLRTSLEKRLKGAMAFYGWTAVATTDLGVTPFDSVYYNVGTHAAVANTILSGAFLNQWPSWATLLLGALVAIGASFLLTRMGTLAGVLVGFGVFLALMFGVAIGYAATGVYAGALASGATVFLSVLGLTLVRFWSTEAEKRFIHGAFGTYLSPEVIKQLEADPDKLSLGGEKKVLTAVFTDVKGFSTFSESMDPNELVQLLNGYLTEMSDIILDTRGTIDKFEGDAIIAFWGAPLPFDDHAPQAVHAALRMKKAEAAMNKRFVETGLAKTPLLTRIGINTGEMTVGNMGTARRMDYTMMGTSVNLAARLEGVNKEYGTWILTTEATRSRVDDRVLFRRLDRVRVIGIKAPVRLFEVTAFRDDATTPLIEKLDLFDHALEAYDAGEWELARKGFDQVLALDPSDAPAQNFVTRTETNRAAGLGPGWDGVFEMKTK